MDQILLKVKAPTIEGCKKQIEKLYPGQAYTIVSHQLVTPLFGIFGHQAYEVSFWLTPQNRKKTVTYQSPTVALSSHPADLETEKQKILQSRGIDPAMQQLLQQVQKLEEKIDNQSVALNAPADTHPTLQKVEDFLVSNDFSHTYITTMITRIRAQFSFDELENFDLVMHTLYQWIGESITIYRYTADRKPRVTVLIGSTGVGKTTTVAKLAAIFSGRVTKDDERKDVRIITTDSFRLGAKEQIAKFGSIIGANVFTANSSKEFYNFVRLFSQEADYILVDTTGNGPREFKRIAELNEILSSCKSVSDVHLVVSASTKSRDLKEIMEQYEPFGYCSVIITKMDETVCIGNVISLLAEKHKQLSYIATGQGVPRDIEQASVYTIMTNLQGYKIDSSQLQKMFPVDQDNQIQWRKI